MRTDKTKNELSYQLFVERQRANAYRRELEVLRANRAYQLGAAFRRFLAGLLFGGKEGV